MGDFDNATKQAIPPAIYAVWGPDLKVKIFTGSKPGATTNADTGTKIGDVVLTGDWMGTEVGGVAPIAAPVDFTVLAPGGTAGHVRLYSSDGTCRWQENVGANFTVTPGVLTTGAPARIGTLNIRGG